VKEFELLINGRNVDTGRYGFLLHADAALRDPGRAIAAKMADMSAAKRLFAGVWPGVLTRSHDPDIQYAGRYAKRHGLPACSAGDLEASYYGRYPIAGPDENLAAMEAAAEAARTYSEFPLDTRFSIFRSFVQRILASRGLLTEASVAEGHPVKAIDWEFERFIEGQAASPRTEELLRRYVFEPYSLGGDDYLIRQPLGAFGVTTPYNAAVVLGLLSIGSAVMSGNTLVVKPSIHTPVSTIILSRLLHEALDEHGAPPGCVNVVVGEAREIVDQWVASPLLDGLVIYAGSKLGVHIGSRALMHYKKAILELAGSDATLVWHDADLEAASEDIVKSRFVGSGQFCAATKRVFVHSAVHDQLLDLVVEKARRLRVGLPSDPNTDITAIGSLSALRSLVSALADALRGGAELVLGGHVVNHTGDPDELGLYLEPTVITNADPSSAVMQEEVFGPILPIAVVDGIDEAIDLVNSSIYGLRASVWATDERIIEAFIGRVRAGGVIVNDDHLYFDPHTPNLGGVKASGIIGTKYFAQEMTYLKYVHVRHPISGQGS
jgi:acyl-CoA reductase-like NAD-dependent aldehyde dehydrogenase